MSFDTKRTRWIRKTEDGSYTMEPVSVLQRSTLICDSCGIKAACPIKENIDRTSKYADVHVRSCHKYVPLLTFRRPLVGLNRGGFNTLRVGRTWYDRLHDGRTMCAMIDSYDNSVIGFCNVTSVQFGSFDEMVRKHAKFNHLAKGVKTDDIVGYVGQVLRKAYGQFLNEDSLLTAIYLERIEDESALLKKAKQN